MHDNRLKKEKKDFFGFHIPSFLPFTFRSFSVVRTAQSVRSAAEEKFYSSWQCPVPWQTPRRAWKVKKHLWIGFLESIDSMNLILLVVGIAAPLIVGAQKYAGEIFETCKQTMSFIKVNLFEFLWVFGVFHWPSTHRYNPSFEFESYDCTLPMLNWTKLYSIPITYALRDCAIGKLYLNDLN